MEVKAMNLYSSRPHNWRAMMAVPWIKTEAFCKAHPKTKLAPMEPRDGRSRYHCVACGVIGPEQLDERYVS
jgi:hypothetical protein